MGETVVLRDLSCVSSIIVVCVCDPHLLRCPPLLPNISCRALPPQGTVANKFYVHNDIFRYQDEVFGDSDSEPPEGEMKVD